MASAWGVETFDAPDIPRVTVRTTCPHCSQPVVVSGIPAEGFYSWVDGGQQIGAALPGLTPGQQDMLATGYHESCLQEHLDDGDPYDGMAL